MPEKQTVLVVAAHPDDEVLGCGATIARHADHGDAVHILIMAEGATSRGAGEDATIALQGCANQAAEILGAAPPRFAGLPDNRMDSLDLLDVVQAVEAVMAEVTPHIIYTHFADDLNIDHRITHQAVATAARPLPGVSTTALYAFESVSSTEWSTGPAFNPNRYVDIAGQLDRKMAALDCYAGEMRPPPHARSLEAIRALATLRGAQGGMESAEAFMVIREVLR